MDNKKYELTNETINVDEHILYRIKSLIDFNDVKAGDLGGYIEKEDNLDHDGNCWIYDDARVYCNARVFGDAVLHNDARVFDYALVYDDAEVYGNVNVYGKSKIYCDARIYGCAVIFGNAKINDYATVHGDAIVYGDVRIYDHAEVYSNARLCGDAKVFGNAKIYGDTKLSSNAYVSNTNDYITIGPIGSREAYTTFYLDKDRNIYVSCGCFYGTIDEFKEQVLETHKDNDLYREQYLLFIDTVKKYYKVD